MPELCSNSSSGSAHRRGLRRLAEIQPFSRHPFFVEHEHHVRVVPLHAGDRASVAVEDPLVGLPELLRDHEAAAQTVELLRELGRPEVGGGEDRDLGVGAAHVDGAARVAAVGAYRDRIVPGEPGPREGQRDRGEAGQDTQVLPPEPLPEQAHDAEETGVPGREHDHRILCVFDPRERLREVALKTTARSRSTPSISRCRSPPATSAASASRRSASSSSGLPSRPMTVMRPRFTLSPGREFQGAGARAGGFEGVEVDQDDMNLEFTFSVLRQVLRGLLAEEVGGACPGAPIARARRRGGRCWLL